MLSPSPDSFMQIDDANMTDVKSGRFLSVASDRLFAYGAGTDEGAGFSNPADTSLDIPKRPRKNNTQLVEDKAEPFMGRAVGSYVVRRIDRSPFGHVPLSMAMCNIHEEVHIHSF